MASLEDTDILVLARHYGSQAVMLTAGIGHRQAAHTTALGKAMLAQLAPDEVKARYATMRTFMVLTPNTNKNLAELMDDLDVIRERGYAIDHEENTLGLVSYAIALPDANSMRNPRAVSVSFLKPRENDELRERLVEDLRELVDTLARHERARHGPAGRA